MAEETKIQAGHPTEGVFMKCWQCQETYRLVWDKNVGLHCPNCWDILIPLEDSKPLPLRSEM